MDEKEKKLEEKVTPKSATSSKTKTIKVLKENPFQVLSRIDVSKNVKKLQKKNKQTGRVTELPYLPWAAALGRVQQFYPEVEYHFVEFDKYGDEIPPGTKKHKTETLTATTENGLQTVTVTEYESISRGSVYRHEGEGFVVECEATIDGITHRQTLPIYDFYGAAAKQPTTELINKAKARCLTKVLATFGLGIDLYAGEELPDELDVETLPQNRITTKTVPVEDTPQPSQNDVKTEPATTEVDPITHIIEQNNPDHPNARGRRMSLLIESRTDKNKAILEWYSVNGTENDKVAATALLKKYWG